MSWMTDDGRHEGYVADVFADGALSGGLSPEGITVIRIGDRHLEYADWQHRPGSEVVGWVPVCECGWRGQAWTRVATPDQQDLAARRIYASDEDTMYVGDTREVEAAAHHEWLEHVQPDVALAAVSTLAHEYGEVGRRLAEAVGRARAAGASWDKIGAAAGITRQSAHERWRHVLAGEPAATTGQA